jgi:hypothetical protein
MDDGFLTTFGGVRILVFNATFNNISVISQHLFNTNFISKFFGGPI